MAYLPIFDETKFLLKKGAASLFSVYLILTSCKKSGKGNKPIMRKECERWTK